MTIYFVEMVDEPWLKIGFTAGDAERRMAQLQTGQPQKLALLGTIPGERDAEAGLHEEFSDLRGNGEWFRKSPELLSIIASLTKYQRPWYFCRVRREVAAAWQAAFSGLADSAYDDCAVRLPADKREKTMAALAKRIAQHRAAHGIDPVWEQSLIRGMTKAAATPRLHPYEKAWAA